MKCKGCSYLKIGYEDDKDYIDIARARCMATPRGRCLTWAVTTYRRVPCNHDADETDDYVLYITDDESEVAEFGVDRVKEFMEDKNAPKWCPLRSDEE